MNDTDASALKEHWFYILLALSSGDRHGADLVRVVLDESDGRLKLWPVKLYASLEAMRDDGLITELAETPAGACSPSSHPAGCSACCSICRASLSPMGRDDLIWLHMLGEISTWAAKACSRPLGATPVAMALSA